ncbi:MAG: sigma-70 family RNA polymerase sigma factor [Steroidobacteraceae bacterium]|nr:sigma-70 family RNA polymerase sigma factor [Steroidobacteraceae bacterium]
MAIDSDAALVARIVATDDRSAFELLVRRHQSPLRNFLRRLTKNDAALADDLAQETFLKAYRSMASFAGTAKFSTWLYRIAYNTFLNDQRTRFPHAELDESQHPSVTNEIESASTESDLERLLGLLPLRQRAVFDLHYKKGMTHQEIAQTLDVPLGTVKSDLARGHESLRKHVTTQKRFA